jgi:hypothetical protein
VFAGSDDGVREIDLSGEVKTLLDLVDSPELAHSATAVVALYYCIQSCCGAALSFPLVCNWCQLGRWVLRCIRRTKRQSALNGWVNISAVMSCAWTRAVCCFTVAQHWETEP